MKRLPTFALSAVLLAGCATTEPTEKPTAAAPVDDASATLAELRQNRARVRHGDGPKLHAELAAVLQQQPRDHHTAFLDAAAGIPSDASWQQLKQLSSDDPKDLWPLYGMALTYGDWKMFPQAEETLARAEAVKPGSLAIALARAQVLLEKGDPGAKAAFQAVLARADLPEAHAGLGQLALASGDATTAKSELQRAAQGDPADLDVQRALAKLAQQSHDSAAAIAAYRAIAEMEPNDGAVRLELGKLEEAAGDLENAKKDLTRAGELRGVDLETAQHLAAIARRGTDPKATQAALEQLARVDKDHAQPEADLADFFAQQKDPKSAEKHYLSALDRDPKNATIRLALARLYRDSGKTREAIETYEQTAAPEAQAELAPLVAALKLPEKPIAGDVNKINARFSSELSAFYKQRLKEKPGLKGTLRLAVDVDPSGKVNSVGITNEGIDDDLLLLHAYFTMKGAQFPKAKRTPVFEVELKP